MPGPPGPAGPPGIGLPGPKVIRNVENNGFCCIFVVLSRYKVFFSCRVQLAKLDHLVHRGYLEKGYKDKRYHCHLSLTFIHLQLNY